MNRYYVVGAQIKSVFDTEKEAKKEARKNNAAVVEVLEMFGDVYMQIIFDFRTPPRGERRGRRLPRRF